MIIKRSMLPSLFMAALMLVPNITHGQEMQRMPTEAVHVLYPEPLRNAAQEVIRLYPTVKNKLEEIFDAEITFVPVITLVEKRGDFQRISGNLPVAALALPDGNQIIIDNSRMNTYPFTLEVTLKHELCHLFLHHITRGGSLPRWFNEGIAQWTSDGIAEIITGERKNLLRQVVLSKRLIPLDSLDASFPGDEYSLILAYEQSRSVVGFLSAEYGTEGVVRTLRGIMPDCDINCALNRGAGISVLELEKKWHMYLERRITWFTYVSTHLYQILFVLAAIVLTIGFIHMMIRKRRYRDEEGEDGPTRT